MFTREQIEELRTNKNVASCSEKSITFTKAFKTEAINLYQEKGLGSAEIFRKAGFDIEVIGKARPKECLRRWNKSFRRKGTDGLSEARGKNGFGQRVKVQDLTDEDKIKRLEVEVAYLKAENDFLAKLRAKRAE